MKTCIIYQLTDPKTFEANSLAPAQQLAIKHDLPLAVVYCLEKWDNLATNQLNRVEADLQPFDIPLITLVGELNKVFQGFVGHTQPMQIFHQGAGSTGKLTKHPIAWPGVVLSTNQLDKLAQAGQLAC